MGLSFVFSSFTLCSDDESFFLGQNHENTASDVNGHGLALVAFPRGVLLGGFVIAVPIEFQDFSVSRFCSAGVVLQGGFHSIGSDGQLLIVQ